MDKMWAKIIAAIIIGLAMIISVKLAVNGWATVKDQESANIEMTGSARKQVKADQVRWTGSFSRTVTEADLKQGYQKMKTDKNEVVKFFSNAGLNEEDLHLTPVAMMPVYKTDNTIREYALSQSIEVRSTDLEKIKTLSKKIDELANVGVIYSSNQLEFTYSKLADERVGLLSQAVQDAKKRATAIANESGRRVSNVRSASMGVVQVLPINSVDISDYGSYDTISEEKEIMVTVKANFQLK